MRRSHIVMLAAVLLGSASSVWSQLTLTIDEYTTDRLSFTVSGSLATDTTGTWEGWLAIKNDWSGNVGVHTELFSSTPSITSQNITIGGTSVNAVVGNGSQAYNDSIYWQNPLGFTNPISALTVVNGSVTLEGSGAFDPVNNPALHLVSGINLTPYDWARLEAVGSAIPEPSTYAVLIGSLVLVIVAWKRKSRFSLGKAGSRVG